VRNYTKVKLFGGYVYLFNTELNLF